MIRKKTKALLLLLMAVISITTAYADEKDMGTWSNNNDFGQNGANLTWDGYSLWDGQSFQNYELRTSGEQQGIHIRNAAQLARYAYDMFNYNNSYWSDRHTRDVWLECDIDLNNKYFSILRSNYYIENATFYGQGHVIRNGHAIPFDSYCALFSYIKGGEIRDLTLVNYNLPSPNCEYSSILCAYAKETRSSDAYHYPTIRNCRVINCQTGINTEGAHVGGIIGYAEHIFLYDNAVVNCRITTLDDIAGGLAGYIHNTEEDCQPFWIERNRVVNSTVHAADDHSGGLIGKIDEESPVVISNNYVQNCTVTCGDEDGGDYLGGLIGYCDMYRLEASSNYVHAQVEAKREACQAGLFAGYFENHDGDSYYIRGALNFVDTEYCNIDFYGVTEGYYQPGVQNQTTAQLTTVRMNDEYIYKQGAMPQVKDGFASNITITTATQLQQLAADVNSGAKTYEGCLVKLGADIDLSSIASFTPIGTSTYPFMGEFDGCGFIISHLTINRPNDSDTGLFGYIHNAYIHDVILEAPNVTGGPYYTGALVGMAQSTCCVSDIWVRPSDTATPYVEGYASTGGIVGRSDKRILIQSCYFHGTVLTRYDQQGDAWAGALIANIKSGDVNYCGAQASVTRQDNGALKKGLIGGMSTLTGEDGVLIIRRCYAGNGDASAGLGLIGSRTNLLSCFYCYESKPLGGNGMALTLGSEHWYYYMEADKLPIPITLSKGLPGSDLAYSNYFYFLPNEDAPDTYHVIKYKGYGGSITIPATVNGKKVTRIDSDVLQGNQDITEVTISENITGIGHRCFEGCPSLKKLTINSVSPLHIGHRAFAGCPSLTTIQFYCGDFDYTYTDNEGVTDGGYAFSNCTQLKTLNFGSTARPLDGFKAKCAFYGCININDIGTSPDSQAYLYLNGSWCLMGKDNTLHMKIKNPYSDSENGRFNIPNGVTLAPGAIDDNPWLVEVTAPASLTTLTAPTFQNCNNLKFIDLSACSNLNTITVDRTAEGNPFYGVNEKTMIYLPSSHSAAQGQKNVVIGNTATELALTDGWDFDPKVDFTFPSATYNRVLQADKGYTACLPFPATLVQAGDMTANWKLYEPSKIQDIEGVTTVTFTEVADGQMQAYTPYYIVVSEGDVIFTCTGSGIATTGATSGLTDIAGASYQFMGTTATIPNSTLYDTSKPAYILQSDGIWYKVPQNESRAFVGPFRAYFQAMGSTNARSLFSMFEGGIGFDDGSDVSTSVEQIRTIDSDGVERYFDLNGRLLSGKPQKSIHILNGKKYINK